MKILIEKDNQQLKDTLNLSDELIFKVDELLIKKKDKSISMEYNLLSTPLNNSKYTAIILVKTFILNKKAQNYYDYIVICNDCGTVRSIRRKQFDTYLTCRLCNTHKSQNSILGILGIYNVLSFSHTNCRRALFYNCKCSLCNKLSIVQKRDILVNKKCSRCDEQSDEGITLIYYKKYLMEAGRRGLEFNITFEEFKTLVNSTCYYCGTPPVYSKFLTKYYNKSIKRDDLYYNGIDRKNSLLGYSIENCVSCCPMCNRMKNKFSEESFKELIIKIYNNLNLSSTTIENTSKDGSELSTSQANGDGSAEHPNLDDDIV